MNNIIRVTIKHVYGVEKVYPANDLALKLANLLGTKTLTHSALMALKDIGFVIEIAQTPSTLGI